MHALYLHGSYDGEVSICTLQRFQRLRPSRRSYGVIWIALLKGQDFCMMAALTQ